MPNATIAPVAHSITPVTTELFVGKLDAVVQDYQPGVMIALVGSGFDQFCDDTQPGRFLGLVEDSVAQSVLTGDVAGAKSAKVIRPVLQFEMKIASAQPSDVGRSVYARFNNEVTYADAAGVTLVNYNLLGTVRYFKTSTLIGIAPAPWYQQGLNVGKVFAAGSGSQALSALHVNKLVEANLAGPLTITLPPVSSCSIGDELKFSVTGTGGFVLTLAGSGTDKVNFAATYNLATAQGSFAWVECDGAQWILKSKI